MLLVSSSARDEVLEEQDPTGAKKRYAYDPAGNMIKAIDPNNGVTSFVYDQRENRVSMTDQQGAVTKYEYDLAGRLVTETDPLGRASRFTYDARGLLTKILDPSGRSETSTFDASGQLLSRVFGDNSSVSYTYDQSGQRTSMTDATGVTRYRYDARGSLTTVTQPDGKAVISRFDASGNRVSLTYPDGSIATFSYDKANQLTGLSHPQAGAVSYSLDAESRLVKEALPDGSTRSYGYTKDLMTSFTQTGKGKKQTSSTFVHDGVGRVTSETINKKTTNFTYDPAGQLLKEAQPESKSTSYSYDKVGNRSPVRAKGKTTNFTFDTAGQLQQAKQGSKLTQYTYDQAGRLLSETGPESSVTRAYGANGLLASRVVNNTDDDDGGGSGNDSWAYTYNGDGTLTKLVTSKANDDDDDSPRSIQNDFIWDTTGVAEILTWSTEGLNTNLFYGYGRALAQQSSKTTVFAQDAHGSTVVKDGDDPFTIARSFDPWGNPNPSSDDDDDEDRIKLGFGYRGELHLGDDIHLRARSYAPQTGRFTTVDPLSGTPGTTTVANPYPYAANDPLNLVDPLGLSPISDGDLQVMGASVTASSTSCAKTLTCSFNDFQRMTVDQRITWVGEFQNQYGSDYNFNGWFNAIDGILQFAKNRKLISGDNWFSVVDAGILQGIQDGFALFMGNIKESINPGTKLWARFFNQRDIRKEDEAESRSLWGAAEMASTQFGLDIAAWFHIKAPKGGKTFVIIGNMFRWLMKQSKRIEKVAIRLVRSRCNPLPGTEGGKNFIDKVKTICLEGAQELAIRAVDLFYDALVDPRNGKLTEIGANIIWSLGIATEELLDINSSPSNGFIRKLVEKIFSCQYVGTFPCAVVKWT